MMTTLLSRRHLLKGFGYGLAACPVCFGPNSTAFAFEKGSGHTAGAPHRDCDFTGR